MNRLKRLNFRGDTIIEVLIVLAVLGFAFAISAATATRGLNRARNAEEHAQALGILNSQIELLRQAVIQKTDVFISGPFCMQADVSVFSGWPAGSSLVPPDANTDTSPYPPSCQEDKFPYNKSIVYVPGTPGRPEYDYFRFRVRWPGLSTLGMQQEEIIYRMPPLP